MEFDTYDAKLPVSGGEPSLRDSFFKDPYALDDSYIIENPTENEAQNSLERKRELEKQQVDLARAEIDLNRNLLDVARSTNFGRFTEWMNYLDITYRDRSLLAKIYAFQCTTNKGKAEMVFRMSLESIGSWLQCDKSNVQKSLSNLCEKGFLIAESNGASKPKTYRLDERKCMLVAISNGFKHENAKTTQDQAIAILEAEGYVWRKKNS